MNTIKSISYYFKTKSTDINEIRNLLFTSTIISSAVMCLALISGRMRTFFNPESHLAVSVFMSCWTLVHIPLFIFRKTHRAGIPYTIFCYCAFLTITVVFHFSSLTPFMKLILMLPQVYAILILALLLLSFVQFVTFSFIICLTSAILFLQTESSLSNPGDVNYTIIILSQIVGVWFLSNGVATILQFHYNKLQVARQELQKTNNRLEYEITAAVNQINEQQTQLHQMQKLEALGQMASIIAHDVNNYLTVILGFGKQALKKCDTDSPLYHPLGQIIKAGDKIAALTNKLLMFSRKQPPPITTIALKAAITEIIPIIRHLVGERCTLNATPPDDSTTISADPVMLEQILINLAANARDAMPEGGTITLSFNQISISSGECGNNPFMKPGDYICLTFTDTGTGIPDKIREKIYEPFFTTKGTGKGTGLGLAVVYGIVKDLNGWIDLATSPDGTTFNIFLPTGVKTDTDSDDQSSAETNKNESFPKETQNSKQQRSRKNEAASFIPVLKPAQSCTGGYPNILVVEDQHELAYLAATTLRDHGYCCTTVASAEEADKLIMDAPNRFNILFSDIVLSGMNGIELAEKITAAVPAISVVLTSGIIAENETIKNMADKGIQFLKKPYSEQALISLFEDISE